jgi:Na+/H+ antiporter NhaD/arsenite permease-like protein
LTVICAAAGALSSVLANDIVCLAMAPMLIEVCARRGITPVPFLLALACASNVGSAATLIGNPQNMFIGESLQLPFAGYLLDGGPPAVLGLVLTWLDVLVLGLFVVNDAFARTGLLQEGYAAMAAAGVDPARPAWLFAITPVLSNLVSNVPAVMLLLPASSGPQAGAVLALASTFAGNLFIVGSIANIIVVEEARRQGVDVDWRVHARTGVPVTLLTLAVAAAWLWLRAA